MTGKLHASVEGVLPSLWAFAFLSYLLRTNIAVAQQYMSRELALNDIQIGYIFSAFLIGYTICQVPAGVLGDRFGPRIVLTLSALICGIATLCTGIVPGLLLSGPVLSFSSLLFFRFVLGAGQAATYPVAMTAVADWFPSSKHAFINSIIFTGSTLGAAFAPPLVAYIMNGLGWRVTFYVTGVLPFVLAFFWWQRTKGKQHFSRSAKSDRSSRWFHLLATKNIFFLCLSYFLYCYSISIFVYWLFKYLVDVRHLSVVSSGWANSLPWLTATLAVPLLGYLSSRLSERRGHLSARRLTATSCLVVSSFLMFIGAGAHDMAVALGAIALSVALLFSTESSYWSTAIDIAHEEAGAAGGLMNLSGNLGGVLSTLLVPILVLHLGWFKALLSGSVFAIAAAIFWFAIGSERGHQSHPLG